MLIHRSAFTVHKLCDQNAALYVLANIKIEPTNSGYVVTATNGRSIIEATYRHVPWDDDVLSGKVIAAKPIAKPVLVNFRDCRRLLTNSSKVSAGYGDFIGLSVDDHGVTMAAYKTDTATERQSYLHASTHGVVVTLQRPESEGRYPNTAKIWDTIESGMVEDNERTVLLDLRYQQALSGMFNDIVAAFPRSNEPVVKFVTVVSCGRVEKDELHGMVAYSWQNSDDQHVLAGIRGVCMGVAGKVNDGMMLQ